MRRIALWDHLTRPAPLAQNTLPELAGKVRSNDREAGLARKKFIWKLDRLRESTC